MLVLYDFSTFVKYLVNRKSSNLCLEPVKKGYKEKVQKKYI